MRRWFYVGKRGRDRLVGWRGHHQLDYPWDDLEPGDYFDVPVEFIRQDSLRSSASYNEQTRRGVRFQVSTLINARGQRVHRCIRLHQDLAKVKQREEVIAKAKAAGLTDDDIALLTEE